MNQYGYDESLLMELQFIAHLFAEHGCVDKAQEIKEIVLEIRAAHAADCAEDEDSSEQTGA